MGMACMQAWRRWPPRAMRNRHASALHFHIVDRCRAAIRLPDTTTSLCVLARHGMHQQVNCLRVVAMRDTDSTDMRAWKFPAAGSMLRRPQDYAGSMQTWMAHDLARGSPLAVTPNEMVLTPREKIQKHCYVAKGVLEASMNFGMHCPQCPSYQLPLLHSLSNGLSVRCGITRCIGSVMR